MAQSPTRVCVFNINPNQVVAAPIVPQQTGSNLIDIVTGVDGVIVQSLGPASYGVPVVLNPNGVLDPSLLNTGVTAVAATNLQLGAPLVHLYSVGGVLTAELAEAGSGSPPTLALSAQGFLTSPIDAGQPGTVAFSGLFEYIDQNHEFSLSSVGAEVYLSAVTPGGITLTRPGAPSLDQTVGYVVAFTAPNVVTAIFLAGFNDFSRLSGCLSTSQICSAQGNGTLVQLTNPAPPASPVTTELGSAANYAVLASAGITNTGSTSITGGVIGSSPTPSITGFNPPPATVDNADAGAAQTAAVAAYNYYSTLPAGTIISSVASQTFTPGTYTASSTLLFSGGTVTLNGAGVYIFQVGSALNVTTAPTTFVLTNGASAADVIFVVGSAATFDANQATGSFVGTIIAQAGISFVGGALNGRAISTGASVTFGAAETITVPSGAGGITAGDIVTFDVFGNTQDSGVSLANVIINPMTTTGDMIYEGAAGPLRLPIGTTGQALTVVGGIPSWQPVVNSFNTRTGVVTFTLADIPQSGATTGEAIVWDGSAWTPSSAATTSFTDILSGTNTSAAMVVDSGATLMVSGSGVVEATQLWLVLVSQTAPTTGQVLTATSGTAAAWATPTVTSPGGANTNVQYNNSGAFGGSAEFVWDTTNTVSAFDAALAVGNNISAGGDIPNSRIDVLDLFTTTTPSIYSGYQMNLTVNGSGDFTGTDYIGYEATMSTDGTANFGSVSTISTSYTHESSGTIDNITGISTSVSANPGTGAANSIVGISAGASAGASTTLVQGGVFAAEGAQGTITTLVGVEVTVVNSAPGIVTTGYGVKVDGIFNTGTFGTYYGVFIGAHAGTAPSTYWAFYATEGTSFFGGPAQINSTLLDGSASPGASGYVLSSTVTGVAWIPATGTPGGSPTEIQYNLAGAFAGIAGSSVTTAGAVALAPTGTGVALSTTGDAAGSDIQDWYVNGNGTPIASIDGIGQMSITPDPALAPVVALSLYSDTFADPIQNWYIQGTANPGMTVTAYGDTRGVQLFMEDTAGATVQLQPGVFKIFGETEGHVFIIPGTGGGDQVTISSTPVTIDETNAINPAVALSVTGDPNSSDIQDWYINGSGTPNMYLDTSGSLWLVNSGLPAHTIQLYDTTIEILSATGQAQVSLSGVPHFHLSDTTPSVMDLYTSYLGFGAAATDIFLSRVSAGVFAVGQTVGSQTGTVATGGFATSIQTQTTTYTATEFDHTINCNGTFTVTLPTTGIVIGQEYYIKNIGIGIITVASTVNIDFGPTVTLSTQGQSVTVQWDGTQYWIY